MRFIASLAAMAYTANACDRVELEYQVGDLHDWFSEWQEGWREINEQREEMFDDILSDIHEDTVRYTEVLEAHAESRLDASWLDVKGWIFGDNGEHIERFIEQSRDLQQ
jgi:hypothetical protein